MSGPPRARAAPKNLDGDEIAVIRFLRTHPTQIKRIRTIARITGRSERTVRRVLKGSQRRVRAKRAEPLAVKKRRSTVLALVRRMKRRRNRATGALEHVGRMFPSLRAIQAELGRRGTVVSVSTIRRDAIARGIRPMRRPKVGKNTPEKLAQRVALARKLLRTPMKCFLFCDETWTNTNDNTCRTEQVAPGDFPTPRVFMKHPACKLLVWSVVGIGFKGPLVTFDQNITADLYETVCGPHIRAALNTDKPRSVFVQDNARPHLAMGRALVEEGYQVAEWPPHSPDLNPIETIWAKLHRKTSQQYPQTKQDVRQAAIRAWSEISQAEIDAHCRGMHKKLKKCIANDGRHEP